MVLLGGTIFLANHEEESCYHPNNTPALHNLKRLNNIEVHLHRSEVVVEDLAAVVLEAEEVLAVAVDQLAEVVLYVALADRLLVEVVVLALLLVR